MNKPTATRLPALDNRDQSDAAAVNRILSAGPRWTLPEDFAERLVIFGAGGLGRRVARVMRSLGHLPLALCDNNAALSGTDVEGIKVFSVSEAASLFPHAIFLIAVWHPSRTEGLRHHELALAKSGCREITCFIPLFWRFPKEFLPNMFWELPSELKKQAHLIAAARALMDERGREEFDRQLWFHVSGDPQRLHGPVPGPQYFPGDLITISLDEVFVDCGAYDGDTLRDFMEVSGGRFRRALALEPDLDNFRKLTSGLSDNRVSLLCTAVGAKASVVRLSSSGASSCVSDTGSVESRCAALDDLLADEKPTFIKMDIEGSEREALRGAAATIKRCRPKLAICVYHRPDDLWRIPLLLKELMPYARLTLRSHMLDGYDTVCYCIPN